MYASGFKYLSSVWNVFDLVIVACMQGTLVTYLIAQWFSPMPFVAENFHTGDWYVHAFAPMSRSSYVYWVKQSRLLMAILLLLSFIKVRRRTAL